MNFKLNHYIHESFNFIQAANSKIQGVGNNSSYVKAYHMTPTKLLQRKQNICLMGKLRENLMLKDFMKSLITIVTTDIQNLN